MTTFTLDDIRDATEKSYASMDIPLSDGAVLKLRNPLRLSKEDRAAMTRVQEESREKREVLEREVEAYRAAVERHEAAVKAATEAGEVYEGDEPEEPEIDTSAQFEALADSLRPVADDATRFNQFIALLGGDLASLATVVRLYRETTQAGEA